MSELAPLPIFRVPGSGFRVELMLNGSGVMEP